MGHRIHGYAGLPEGLGTVTLGLKGTRNAPPNGLSSSGFAFSLATRACSATLSDSCLRLMYLVVG